MRYMSIFLLPAGRCWIGLGSNLAGVAFSGSAGGESVVSLDDVHETHVYMSSTSYWEVLDRTGLNPAGVEFSGSAGGVSDHA